MTYTSNNTTKHIHTSASVMPIGSIAAVSVVCRTVNEAEQTIQYFDGLGTSSQIVRKRTLIGRRSIVAPVLYGGVEIVKQFNYQYQQPVTQ